MKDRLDLTRILFIHGLMSSGKGFKASLLRQVFPTMLTPDFIGSLDERMDLLESILGEAHGWTIIGSSMGGLMAAIYTCTPQHAYQVRKLVLLAPALVWPDFAQDLPAPVDVPTVIYHGKHDDLIPLDMLRPLAERIFSNLTFQVVDDDHRLEKTVQEINWKELLQ